MEKQKVANIFKSYVKNLTGASVREAEAALSKAMNAGVDNFRKFKPRKINLREAPWGRKPDVEVAREALDRSLRETRNARIGTGVVGLAGLGGLVAALRSRKKR
jgi:hypothetical protein